MKIQTRHPIKRAPGEVAKIPRNSKDEEHMHQAALIEWAAVTDMPHLFLMHDSEPRKIGGYLFAVPNGGHRSVTQGARLRAEGVKPGVSDLMLPIPTERFHSMWIEMKSSAGSMTRDQLSWFRLMTARGFYCCTCRSVDEAITEIQKYLGVGHKVQAA